VKHPLERRFVRTEVRAKSDGHIEGHGAVFGEEYVLWDSASYRVVETIKAGTFARAIKEKQDVRSCFNHDPSQLLGRTSAKTLSIEEDDEGLYFDCDPPDTQVGRDVRTLVKRRDVTGCSFSFVVTKETVTEEKNGDKTVRRRQIEDVDLFELGPVTFPAYEGTDVKARTKELRSLFPAGVPSCLVGAIPELRKDSDDDAEEQDCRCACRACMSAECEECDMLMARCGDQQRCNHMARSVQRGDTPTKRVDGEDLTAGGFIYVGDAAKPETWSLPWKFKSEAKIKSHLRNALARFGQTQKIPADKKAAAWKKLVRLCKKYGIAVSDEESKSLGLSAEQRKELRGSGACDCICPECVNADCENCSDVNCDDENCDHGDRAGLLSQEHAQARTRALKLSL
jgi:HK97 family phage prohead protease